MPSRVATRTTTFSGVYDVGWLSAGGAELGLLNSKPVDGLVLIVVALFGWAFVGLIFVVLLSCGLERWGLTSCSCYKLWLFIFLLCSIILDSWGGIEGLFCMDPGVRRVLPEFGSAQYFLFFYFSLFYFDLYPIFPLSTYL